MHDPIDSGRTATVIEHLRRREAQCREERQAYRQWLGVLTPVRWFMVGSSTALSAVAGATILSAPQLLGKADWHLIAGVCALGASVLSGLHAAFNCDAYQEECRRLGQTFYGLEMSYQAAQAADPAELPAKAGALDARFEEAIGRATTTPPAWCRQSATTSNA